VELVICDGRNLLSFLKCISQLSHCAKMVLTYQLIDNISDACYYNYQVTDNQIYFISWNINTITSQITSTNDKVSTYPFRPDTTNSRSAPRAMPLVIAVSDDWPYRTTTMATLIPFSDLHDPNTPRSLW